MARRIQTELETYLGSGTVFLDTMSIDAGAQWTRTLSEHLGTCLVVFVIVTPDWPVSELSHADDWVRREIRDSIGLGN